MAGKPEEKLRSVLVRPSSFGGGYNGLNNRPFLSPDLVDALRRAPRLTPNVTIGGQRYREVDNGRAGVLVREPPISPAQRAAIERAVFMADRPMAGASYGIAALAGASPQGRDKAMAVGAVADAAMLGASPFGARTRSPIRSPTMLPPMSAKPRDPVRYGPANATDQASYGSATVTKSMYRTGEDANRRLAPPGWRGNGDVYLQDRSHLIAKELGGTGRTTREIVTLDRHTNQKLMRSFESAVGRRVRNGEVVEYFVKPLYDSKNSAPSWVVMTADGSRGGFTPTIVPNPTGRTR